MPVLHSNDQYVNQVAAGNSQTENVDELVPTLSNEIANLKSWNKWRRNSVERDHLQYNSSDQSRNIIDSRDQLRNRYYSKRKNRERTSRDNVNSSDLSDGTGCWNLGSVRLEEYRDRKNYDNLSSNSDKRETRKDPLQNNNGTSSQTNRNLFLRNNSGSNCRGQNHECGHCILKHCASIECKACFKSLRFGHFRWPIGVPRSKNQLVKPKTVRPKRPSRRREHLN